MLALEVQNGLVPEPPSFLQLMEGIDAYEDILNSLEKFDIPTEHHFWGGFYIRQVEMPAGMECTTKMHGKRHSFCISKGKVEVVDNLGTAVVLEAPYVGITEAGTRRALRVLEDCVWTTFHFTTAQTPEEAEDDLIIPQHREGIDYCNARNQHRCLIIHHD